jgi:predicted dehydrogenase
MIKGSARQRAAALNFSIESTLCNINISVMTTPIRTCVLGVGLAGLTFHIPFVLAQPDLFTLTAVLERNPQTTGGKVHDRFGINTRIHRSLDEVLADQEIELVIVGTPNATHYEFTKRILEAGKHGERA